MKRKRKRMVKVIENTAVIFAVVVFIFIGINSAIFAQASQSIPANMVPGGNAASPQKVKFSEQEKMKYKRIMELEKKRDESAISMIQPFLNDDSLLIKKAALKAIGTLSKRLKSMTAIPIILKIYKEDSNAGMKAIAKRILEDLKYPNEFIEELKGKDNAKRVLSIKSLGKIKDARSINALRSALSEEKDEKIKNELGRALLNLDDEAGIEYMVKEFGKIKQELMDDSKKEADKICMKFDESNEMFAKHENKQEVENVKNIKSELENIKENKDIDKILNLLSSLGNKIGVLINALYYDADEGDKKVRKCKDEALSKYLSDLNVAVYTAVNNTNLELKKIEDILTTIARRNTEESARIVADKIMDNSKRIKSMAVKALALCASKAKFASPMLYAEYIKSDDKVEQTLLLRTMLSIGEENSVLSAYNFSNSKPETKQIILSILTGDEDTSNSVIATLAEKVLNDESFSVEDLHNCLNWILYLYNHAVDTGKLSDKLTEPFLSISKKASKKLADIEDELYSIVPIGTKMDQQGMEIVNRLPKEKKEKALDLLDKQYYCNLLVTHLKVNLSYIGTDEAIKDILKEAESSEYNDRFGAYQDLGPAAGTGNRKAINKLSDAIKNEADENIKLIALSSLAMSSDPKSRKVLLDIIKNETNNKMKQVALLKIGYWGSEDSDVEILLAGLKDSNIKIKQQAARALVVHRSKTALPALAEGLSGMNQKQRAAILSSIRNMDGQEYPSNSSWYKKIEEFMDVIKNDEIKNSCQKRIALIKMNSYIMGVEAVKYSFEEAMEIICEQMYSKDPGIALEVLLYHQLPFMRNSNETYLSMFPEAAETAREEEKELDIPQYRANQENQDPSQDQSILSLEYSLCTQMHFLNRDQINEAIEIAEDIMSTTKRKDVKDYLEARLKEWRK